MRELSSKLGGVELSGSRALLDDSEEFETSNSSSSVGGAIGGRRPSAAPGMGRQPYPQMPQVSHGLDHYGFSTGPPGFNNTWVPQPNFTNSLPPPSLMAGWGAQPHSSFGAVGGNTGRPSQPRNAALRQMLVDATTTLASNNPDGWINIIAVKKEVEKLIGHRNENISIDELEALCDTEGNQMNGGGHFEVDNSNPGQMVIRFISDPRSSNHSNVGAPGEIGSPVSHGLPRYGTGLGIGGF